MCVKMENCLFFGCCFFFFPKSMKKIYATAYFNGDRAHSKWPPVPQKNYLFMCWGLLKTGLHKKRRLSEMLVGRHHTVGGGARWLLGDRQQLLSKEMERVYAQGGGRKGGNCTAGRRGNSERQPGKKSQRHERGAETQRMKSADCLASGTGWGRGEEEWEGEP